jgi:hypothetical protein
MSCQQKGGQNYNLMIADESSKNMAKFNNLGTIVTNQN